jgi:hypothetical protein
MLNIAAYLIYLAIFDFLMITKSVKKYFNIYSNDIYGYYLNTKMPFLSIKINKKV